MLCPPPSIVRLPVIGGSAALNVMSPLSVIVPLPLLLAAPIAATKPSKSSAAETSGAGKNRSSRSSSSAAVDDARKGTFAIGLIQFTVTLHSLHNPR